MPIAVDSGSALAVSAGALRSLVASSATFQAVTATASEAAAKNHVHLDWAEDRLAAGVRQDPFPRAVIEQAADRLIEPGRRNLKYEGELCLSFEFNLGALFTAEGGTAGDNNDEATWFRNKVGKILREMFETAPTAPQTYLQITEMEMMQSPGKARLQETDVWGIVYFVRWL